MIPSTMVTSFSRVISVTVLFFLIASSAVFAQRGSEYQSLAARNQQQNIFFDYFTLPGDTEGSVKFVAAFRMSYNFLPFRKLNDPENENTFFSSVGLGIEIFKAKERVKKKDEDNVSITGLEPAGRDSWKDTAYAQTYEQTQSGSRFIQGYLQVELKPGVYNYLLQLNRGSENNEQSSSARQIVVADYAKKKKGTIILAGNVSKKGAVTSLQLLNFADKARYGKDYYVLVQLPNHTPKSSYSLTLNRINTSKEDTTSIETSFSTDISASEIYENIKPVISKDGNQLSVDLQNKNGGYAYALVKIPNSTLPNAVYRLKVNEQDNKQPIAQSIIKSFWPEIPTSLLNLDVATEMTKFIVDDQTLKNLKSGSDTEREKKFREFWKSKDPTPNTEFNELMTEYYGRIDYAYEKFSSINFLGFETDQGRIYIKYGKPDNIERKFPGGSPAVEIWSYGPKKFVFQATSGFGDFQLVSK